MRLKSLDIKGFKSFANQTTIKFDEGVTGVVGPNGSGKSNIVDSIRWVLGEQKSKELRLESMGDVIFNGTKKKKKSGAAQVTLTFENTKNILPTEYKEVSISRTLYRSGDSEYRLNNVKCRLKDIKNLFLDSGIGSNTYAIIELGMVDAILSDQDNARRKMFEQAAGISKYKIRKKEALGKLELTRADLDRVEDLLFELDTNMKSLEKQAKRTERFYKIKEQYKALKITVSKAKIAKYEEELFGMKTKHTERMNHLTDVKVALSKSEADLESLKTKNLNDEKVLNELQKKLNGIIAKIQEIEGVESLKKQEIHFLRNTETRLHSDLGSSKNRKIEVEGLLKSKEQTLALESKELAVLIADFESMQQAYIEFKGKVESKSQQASSQQQQFQVAQSAVFDIEKELLQVKSTKQIAEDQLARIKDAEKVNQSEVASLKEKVEASEAEVTHLKIKLDKAEITFNQALEQKTKLEDVKLNLREQKTNLDRTLDRSVNERNLLKNMIESLEGFPESVKFVHSQTKGKIPLLSDLFLCPDQYKHAIESYLESHLHHFVANTEEEAQTAIKLLKEGQKGRASFFILSRMEAFNGLVEPDSIIHKLEFDKKYKKLFEYLFGSVKFGNTYNGFETEFLLEDSTLISKKFTLSGGSVGLFEGKKVGRKKAFESLSKSIEKIETEQSKLQVDIEKNTTSLNELTLEDLRKEKSNVELAYNSASYQFNSAETQYKQLLSKIEYSQATNEEILQKLQVSTQRIEELDLSLIKEQSILEALKAAINDESGTLSQLQGKLTEQSSLLNAKQIDKIKKENYINSLNEQKTSLSSQLGQIHSKITASESELVTVKEKLESLTVSQQGKNDETVKLYEDKKLTTEELSKVEQTYFNEKSGIQEKERAIRDLHSQQLQLQSAIGQAREREQTLKYELKSLIDRLSIEFEISEEDIKKEQELSLEEGEETPEANSLEESNLKLEKLELRIQNYGDINPMAITAYNEIKERCDYIIGQRDDILDASEDLQKTIKEIEVEANEKFKDAFEKIKVHFQEVFRTFFTDDDACDLILLDEDSPLDSPIEILAKPKGKRPKSLSQLSGGEKTLTATALLFALYLLKPAPFCIFDEVDAPLDDLNVQKFTKLIKQFSQNSQFVIITHNKVTMAAVDMLYGVFMQEIGISEISAVDFSDKSYDFNYQPILN